MDRILIIDGLNYIYRSKVKAIEHLGPYIIVYNFFKLLRSLCEKFAPSKIFFVREGRNNFRYSLYHEYKANRIIKTATFHTKEEQDSFYDQCKIIFDLLKYLPITQVWADGYEGDDIINTLCYDLQYEENIIVSNDQDLIQILQKQYKHTKIYNPFKKVFVETPKYFVLIYKSLYGDKADNIPGVVGKKKATTLASDPEKLKAFLETNEEARIQFKDNMELIQLRLVPMDELVFEEHQVNFGLLKEEFRNMKFESLIRTETFTKIIDTFKDIKL